MNLADPNGSALPFLKVSDLYDYDDAEPWLIEHYLVRGDKTVISARPKAGKSTLAFAWCAALLREVDEFLGKRVSGESVGVLYCTEEVSRTGIRDKARRFNLTDDDPFLVLRHVDVVLDESWPSVVSKLASAAEQMQEEWGVRHVLIVIDGFAKWAGFDEGQENDQSVTQRALRALDPLLKADHAVLVLHHAGWTADRERGSSGIAGEAGIRLFIDGEGTEPRRIEHKGGRHGDPCEPLTYSLTHEGFERLGSAPPKRAAGLAEVLRIIDQIGKPTTQEIAERSTVSVTTIRARLNKLRAMTRVRHVDEGQGGDRRRRWMRATPLEILFSAAANFEELPHTTGISGSSES